jgi:rhodanese-related sulfurtransferase
MKNYFLAGLFFFMAGGAKAQFKNDNVLFRTVYPENLCKELSSAKDYLLLDVRSAAEFSDTATNAGLLFGRLNGAKNINVRELGKRLSEIADYKNKTVYVYCSHSQRSRRASKMLADSGFTKVVNINGGITAILQLPPTTCLNALLLYTAPYHVLSPVAFCEQLSSNRANIFLLDIRNDSAFQHIDRDAEINSIGSFRNAVHIPLAELKNRLNEIPHNKNIILIDLDDRDAVNAAKLLLDNGFKNVSAPQEDLDRFLSADPKTLSCIKTDYISPVKYKLLSTFEFSRLFKNNAGYTPLDIRPDDEYNNKNKNDFKNIGHIKNAIHIPKDMLAGRLDELESYKNKPVVVYGFSDGTIPYEAAALLSANGFTDVYVLRGGLFNLRWTAANVEGYHSLMDWVTDVPAENY